MSMPRETKDEANQRQIGGDHYRKKGVIQHWDFAALREYDYFQGQITKYVDRWKNKNGIQDLEKAQHFLEKYIEIEKEKVRTGLIATNLSSIVGGGGYYGGKQQNPFGFDPIDDATTAPVSK